MKPTEILSGEHRIIEQVLDCLEKIAQNCATEGRLDRTSAEQALDFFRNFADRCHHGKEETHLFPAMEAKGFPRQGGPTGVMLSEHEQGRAYIRGMAEVIDRAAAGSSRSTPGARRGVQSNGTTAIIICPCGKVNHPEIGRAHV